MRDIEILIDNLTPEPSGVLPWLRVSEQPAVEDPAMTGSRVTSLVRKCFSNTNYGRVGWTQRISQ